jgi:hypothetical protein
MGQADWLHPQVAVLSHHRLATSAVRALQPLHWEPFGLS